MIDQNAAPSAPLAEGRWLWRRLYVYGTTILTWLLLDRLIVAVPPHQAPALAQGLMALLGLTLVLYLVAPTAQQLINGVFALSGRQNQGRGR